MAKKVIGTGTEGKKTTAWKIGINETDSRQTKKLLFCLQEAIYEKGHCLLLQFLKKVLDKRNN